MKRLVFILCVFSSVHFLIAQSDSTRTGEVVDAQIIIEKEKEIILENANKIVKPVEIRSFESNPIELEYVINKPDLNWPGYTSDVSYATNSWELAKPTYQNYITGGYGNFGSPLIGVGLFHQLSGVKTGLTFRHESFATGPIADENSGSSSNALDIDANYTIGNLDLSSRIGWAREGFRFYGNTGRNFDNTSTLSLPSVAYSDFSFSTNVAGGFDSGSIVEFEPAISVTNQGLTEGARINQETLFQYTGSLLTPLTGASNVGLRLDGLSAGYESGPNQSRGYTNLQPYYGVNSEDYFFEAGFTVAFASNRSDNQTSFYPYGVAGWNFTDKWQLNAEVSGGIEPNTLNGLLAENRFLDDSLDLRNRNVKSRLVVGLDGSPSKRVKVRSSFNVSREDGLPFFLPDNLDSARFLIAYDSSTVTTILFDNAIDFTLSTRSVLGVNFKWYQFNLGSLQEAWHRPTTELQIYWNQVVKETFRINTNLLVFGGIQAPVSQGSGTQSLDPIIDLNLELQYQITDRANAFVLFNNLFGNEYERYIGYPVRGTSFKLGGTFRF